MDILTKHSEGGIFHFFLMLATSLCDATNDTFECVI